MKFYAYHHHHPQTMHFQLICSLFDFPFDYKYAKYALQIII